MTTISEYIEHCGRGGVSTVTRLTLAALLLSSGSSGVTMAQNTNTHVAVAAADEVAGSVDGVNGINGINGSTMAPCAKISIGINSATPKELMRLTGIGRRKAEAIVRYREQHGPFARLGDLQAVRGISKKLVERNRERLTLD